MTVEEMQKAIDQLKADGHSDEDLVGAFYKMYQNDEITFDEFDGIVNLLGYHLTEEFRNMSDEDKKSKLFEKTDEAAEGVDKEDIEEAKEVEDGPTEESKEESKDEDDEEGKAMKNFGIKEEKEEPKPAEESKSEPENDDDEEKKAMKQFGLN